jgi:hypothetical protein
MPKDEPLMTFYRWDDARTEYMYIRGSRLHDSSHVSYNDKNIIRRSEDLIILSIYMTTPTINELISSREELEVYMNYYIYFSVLYITGLVKSFITSYVLTLE